MHVCYIYNYPVCICSNIIDAGVQIYMFCVLTIHFLFARDLDSCLCTTAAQLPFPWLLGYVCLQCYKYSIRNERSLFRVVQSLEIIYT